MLYKKKKNVLNLKRSELVAATSLELLKQKKITDSRRVLGRNFAKQSKSSLICEILRNPCSYIVAVKFVNAGPHWGDFSTSLSRDNSLFQSVFPVTHIRNLYPFLVGDDNLR